MTPTSPSISIAPYPMGRMSDSRSIIFGVVPERISAWKPEIAPHAMVMNAKGKSGPGMIGPPPCVNCVKGLHLQRRIHDDDRNNSGTRSCRSSYTN